MKNFKKIFNESLEENIQNDLKVIFKGNAEYDKLKKAAKKDNDEIPNFLDYIYNVVGDSKIEKMSKKYKIDMDKLAAEFLK